MNNVKLDGLTVSVIVPCRNEAPFIAAFIESLRRQVLDGMCCEFLIADGMSDDGTRQSLDELRSLLPGLKLIDNPEKIVPTGLNRAILAATGEIIVRLDVHTKYAPDYLKSCVSTLLRTGAANAGGPMRNEGTGYTGRAIAAAFHSVFASGGAKFHQEDFEGSVDTVTYGCWLRETLLDIGLFDPALVRNQDDELNLRLVKAGGVIWQSPSIVMAYQPRPSLRKLFIQYFQYGFWRVRVIRKHRMPANWRHLVPAAFILWTISAPICWGAFRISGHQNMAAVIGDIWVCSTAVYGLACLVASLMTANRKGTDLLPILPLVFFTYHAAYGLGFLTALIMSWNFDDRKALDGRFAALGR